MSEFKVWQSWLEWCDKNPIRKVSIEPVCEKEDANLCMRVVAENNKQVLENLNPSKDFEVVEYNNKFYVIEKDSNNG